MTLYTYTSKCTEFAEELADALTIADIDALRADCAAIGLRGWYGWLNSSAQTVSAFVASTPSQRRKKKAWQDQPLRRRLVLGAIWYVNCGHRLLDMIDEYRLEPGGSYRDTAARAGDAYVELVYNRIPDWPFDDPNPFDET